MFFSSSTFCPFKEFCCDAYKLEGFLLLKSDIFMGSLLRRCHWHLVEEFINKPVWALPLSQVWIRKVPFMHTMSLLYHLLSISGTCCAFFLFLFFKLKKQIFTINSCYARSLLLHFSLSGLGIFIMLSCILLLHGLWWDHNGQIVVQYLAEPCWRRYIPVRWEPLSWASIWDLHFLVLIIVYRFLMIKTIFLLMLFNWGKDFKFLLWTSSCSVVYKFFFA